MKEFKFDQLEIYGCLNSIKTVVEYVETNRVQQGDIQYLSLLENKLCKQIALLKEDIKDQLLASGFYIRPGDEVLGFDKDNNLVTVKIYKPN